MSSRYLNKTLALTFLFPFAAINAQEMSATKTPRGVLDQILSEQATKGLNAYKITIVPKRLIGYCEFDADSNKILDTAILWYSGNRYSDGLAFKNSDKYDINYWHGFTGTENKWGYDSLKRYSVSGNLLVQTSQRNYSYIQDSIIKTSEQLWFNGFTQDFYYDNQYNNSGTLKSSLFYQEDPSLNNTYLQANVRYCIYDNQGVNIYDSVYDFFASQPSVRYDFSYDNIGNKYLTTNSMWINNTWSPVSREVRNFNSQGLLLKDSLGFLVNGVWVYGECNFYNYDSYGRLIKDLLMKDVNLTGVLTNNMIDSFSYSPGMTIPDTRFRFGWFNNSWQWIGSYFYSINANLNYDTLHYVSSDTFYNRKEVMVYDADAYLTKHLFFRRQSQVPYRTLTYYYDVPATISSLHLPQELHIYPNPTRKTLTISGGAEPIGDIVVSDITGRMVIKEFTSESLFNIDVSSLLCGIYLLSTSRGYVKFRKE